MTLNVIESVFKLKAGWSVTLNNVIFVADIHDNGCASLVPYQDMYEHLQRTWMGALFPLCGM